LKKTRTFNKKNLLEEAFFLTIFLFDKGKKIKSDFFLTLVVLKSLKGVKK